VQKDAQREMGGARKAEAATTPTTLHALNDYIATAVARLLCSVVAVTPAGQVGRPQAFDGFTLQLAVAPVPLCKFTVAHTSSPGITMPAGQGNTTLAHRGLASWPDLVTSLARNLPFSERALLTAHVQFRGVAGPAFWERLPALQDMLARKAGTCSLLPLSVHVSAAAALAQGEGASVTLLLNAASLLLPTLTGILERATCMYAEGAYLHHYERFLPGEARGYFEDALATLREVVESYAEWGRGGVGGGG
jgi:hypothetical protein